MTFPGRPFRAIMSRAFHRYRKGDQTQDVNDDKLDSLATAEWPTTPAQPMPEPMPEPTTEPRIDAIVDPAIESVFEKSDAPTDLSQKYEEASTSSPFKQISADQIEEVNETVDGNEDDQVSSDSEPLITVDEAATDSVVEVETDQPVAESAPEQTEVQEQEQPTAELAATDQVESQQPVPEPVEPAPVAPLPPSVDSMISNSMGNIFQKKVTKDSNLQALLDRHPNEDMRSLAEDLRKFSEDIGASEKSE